MDHLKRIWKLLLCILIIGLQPLFLTDQAFANPPTAIIVVTDDKLALDETARVTITFSEPVTGFSIADLTGPGSFNNLTTNDNTTYTVDFKPNVSDGLYVISLDNAGVMNAASQAGTGTTESNPFIVDTVKPSVTSVTVPAYATYGAGENLDFTVNMDEPVVVNTIGGIPKIEIFVGATTDYAYYISGSGTGALLFRYTVQTGQSDSNGITIGALSLNGGSIKDAAGNDANTGLNSVGSTAGVLVQTTVSSPTILSVSPTSGPTSGGTIVTLTGTNLLGATAVKFGTTAATDVTVNSATSITATAPAGSAGTVDVTVTTAGGTSATSAADEYTYYLPTYTISALSDETLNALTAGYVSGTQETKTVTVTRTGTGDLASLVTALGGTNASSFAITQPTATTLNSGTPSTTFTVKANDGLAAGTYTATVTVSAAGMTPVTFTVTQVVTSRNSGGTGGSPTSPVAPTHSVIDQNGIIVDSNTIDTHKPSVVLEVTPKDGVAYVSIPAILLTEFGEKNATFFIAIKTPYGSYNIPVNLASLIPGLQDLLTKNGLKAEDISFKITLTDKSGDKDIQAAVVSGLPNGQVLGAIVDFSITIINTKSKQVIGIADKFNSALTRIIPMPKNMTDMPGQWGAFRYNETTKNFEFIPAKKVLIDGAWYVTINSYSNSVYVVAHNPVSFTDMSKHWSKSFVELAAAKGLVEGDGDGKYNPDKAVTRAEFTAMIVRALGRSVSDGNAAPYVDVKQGAWYFDEVAKAKELGLLDFTTGASFKPDQPLSREEMASMLAAVIKREKSSIAKDSVNLNGYKDIGSVDAAYLEDVRAVVALQIMNGTSANTFDPKGETTRAHAAVVFIRMLQTLGSIDR